ncbi:unnamed protein product [Ceutorhynchus assimilis]|uniref:Lipoprotein n=1 Tax=Ceutorhynchus assimilis TaxID=467358 RepID=A0A9P0GRB7_9CUCU|nr:unnamed protein product [Ceutorhynchus assimilis]
MEMFLKQLFILTFVVFLVSCSQKKDEEINLKEVPGLLIIESSSKEPQRKNNDSSPPPLTIRDPELSTEIIEKKLTIYPNINSTTEDESSNKVFSAPTESLESAGKNFEIDNRNIADVPINDCPMGQGRDPSGECVDIF